MAVGFYDGVLFDDARPHWREPGPRPIRWSAWSPAVAEGADRRRAPDPPPPGALFRSPPTIRRAPLPGAPDRFPTALLSHGTGGAGSSLGWLAARLAARGYLCLAPSHHGNTMEEPPLAEGFACWWERARDLSLLLDRLRDEGPFAGRIDEERVYVAGFSLGAHSALSLMGARTDMALFLRWAEAAGMAERGPAEFPDLPRRIPGLLSRDGPAARSFARQGDAYRDARVRAAFLMAPAPPVRALTPASLAAIEAPIAVAAGRGDREAPFEAGAAWLRTVNPRIRLHPIDPRAGHYVFLPEASAHGRRAEPALCVDPEGVVRRLLHDETAAQAAALFASAG